MNKPPKVNVVQRPVQATRPPVKSVPRAVRPVMQAPNEPATSNGNLYKVNYAYTANGANQLTISIGDTIDVVKEGDAGGWWLGKLNGVEGWVPSAYIEKIVQTPLKPIRPVVAAPQPSESGQNTPTGTLRKPRGPQAIQGTLQPQMPQMPVRPQLPQMPVRPQAVQQPQTPQMPVRPQAVQPVVVPQMPIRPQAVQPIQQRPQMPIRPQAQGQQAQGPPTIPRKPMIPPKPSNLQ